MAIIGMHIRIDAKRQALDALDDLRRRAATNGNGKPENSAEIERIVEVADGLTSQFAFAGIQGYLTQF